MSPEMVKRALGSGLLAFPVTNFTADGDFDEAAYRANIAANLAHRPAGLFVAGGTGEFFSLTQDECRRIVAAAVAVASADAARRVPIIAGIGYGTAMAVEFARQAEAAGADGVLVLPPYLMRTEQEGLCRHLDAICRAVGIAVIPYNRDNAIIAPDTLARLAERHRNPIGFKDGHGDVEQLVLTRQTLGDRLVYIGGMPTAEVYAVPYLAAGFSTYSSAVFNFIPRAAQRFYAAVRSGDRVTTDDILARFFKPYLALRNRRRGYAVSIVKAGMRVVGRPAGPVRSPLVDLTAAEEGELRGLIGDAFGEAAG
jgi:5-dehydro-4-deoxyglucarate dehydratase